MQCVHTHPPCKPPPDGVLDDHSMPRAPPVTDAPITAAPAVLPVTVVFCKRCCLLVVLVPRFCRAYSFSCVCHRRFCPRPPAVCKHPPPRTPTHHACRFDPALPRSPLDGPLSLRQAHGRNPRPLAGTGQPPRRARSSDGTPGFHNRRSRAVCCGVHDMRPRTFRCQRTFGRTPERGQHAPGSGGKRHRSSCHLHGRI